MPKLIHIASYLTSKREHLSNKHLLARMSREMRNELSKKGARSKNFSMFHCLTFRTQDQVRMRFSINAITNCLKAFLIPSGSVPLAEHIHTIMPMPLCV